MPAFLQGSINSVYDKFDALSKGAEKSHEGAWLPVSILVLALVGAYFLLTYWRRIFGIPDPTARPANHDAALEQRAQTAINGESNDVVGVPDALPVDRLDYGIKVGLYWTKGNHRVGCGLTIVNSDSWTVVVKPSKPLDKTAVQAKLYVPETGGHVLVYPVAVEEGGIQRATLQQSLGAAVIRIGSAVRVPADVRATAALVDAEGGKTGRPVAIRVIDVSAGGFGVVAEEALIPGSTVAVKVLMPGQSETLDARFLVRWCDNRSIIACRSGIELPPDDAENRARLADFVFANHSRG